MSVRSVFKNAGKKINILMIPSAYPTEVSPLNSIFFKEHAQAIALLNDVSVVYAYPLPSKFLSQNKLFKIEYSLDNNVKTARIKFLRSFKKVDIIISILLTSLFSFRIIRIHSFNILHAQKFFPAGVISVVLGQLFDIPVVITEHSGNFAHAVSTPLRSVLTKYALRKANKIVAVSRVLANSIKTYNEKLDIKVIPNPVNVHKFKPSYTGQNLTKKILHVSSLKPVKGISYLIEAVANLKNKRNDFIVDIVGGDVDYIQTYKNLAKNKQIENIIRFHGKKSNDEVVNFMNRCSFFVFPSIEESFGVVLIEAMACGKPVIATKSGGPEEIVRNESGILIPPEDTESLTEALDYMLDNFQKNNSKHIRQYIKDNFSYEVFGEALSKIYYESLGC